MAFNLASLAPLAGLGQGMDDNLRLQILQQQLNAYKRQQDALAGEAQVWQGGGFNQLLGGGLGQQPPTARPAAPAALPSLSPTPVQRDTLAPPGGQFAPGVLDMPNFADAMGGAGVSGAPDSPTGFVPPDLAGLGAPGTGYAADPSPLRYAAADTGTTSDAAPSMPSTLSSGLRPPSGALPFEPLGPRIAPPTPPPTAAPQGGAAQGAPTAAPDFSGGSATGRVSWYGNYGGWHDESDSGAQAGGVPVEAGQPGLALRIPTTSPDFGALYRVTFPNGKQLIMPQTDVGPSSTKPGARDRLVDINAPAAQAAGYTPKTFPTDGQVKVERVGGRMDPNTALATGKQIAARDSSPNDMRGANQGTNEVLRQHYRELIGGMGTFDIDGLVKMIDQRLPNASPETKVGVFHNLFNTLHPLAKEQYARQIAMLQFEISESDKAEARGEKRDEFNMRMAELAAQRAATNAYRQDLLGKGGGIYNFAAPGEPPDFRRADPQGVVHPLTDPSGAVVKPSAMAKAGSKDPGPPDAQSIEAVAKNIAEYRTAPLSGWAMNKPFGQAVMAKVRELNPDYSAPKYAARVSASRAWESGRQADALRFIDVSMDHLKTADEAATALETGDNRTLNRLRNAISREFGYEQVPDFETAKMIVSDEVIKAIVGGVATGGDRDKLQAQFDAANSPEQLRGVTAYLRRLIAGQLGGMKRQAMHGTGISETDFNDRLSPESLSALKRYGRPSDTGGAATPGGGAPNLATASMSELSTMLQNSAGKNPGEPGYLTPQQLMAIQDRYTALGGRPQ